MFLTVYVDDILLTDRNTAGIREMKKYLRIHFVTKDVEKSRYFLNIEFTYANERMALS